MQDSESRMLREQARWWQREYEEREQKMKALGGNFKGGADWNRVWPARPRFRLD